jgi:hypothetical protein
MLPECKTRDEEDGIRQWNKFKNAVVAWRISKIRLFESRDGIPEKAAQLRKAYEELKAKLAFLEATTGEPCPENNIGKLRKAYDDLRKKPRPETVESQLGYILSMIKKWAKSFKESERILETSIDSEDYMI